MSAQLPLDLPLEPRFERADFLPAPCNIAALTMIDRWPDWPDPSLTIIGPAGSGKSHLAAIWAARAGARIVDPKAPPAVGELAAAPRALALDGLDDTMDETAMFHLVNMARETGSALLMTARRAPGPDWPRLPDLLSRLRRAPMVEIGAPDDELIRAVLDKLFRDRQLLVDPNVSAFAAVRLERSLGAARAFVADIDRAALAQGRRVSRALAAQLLGAVGEQE